LAGTLLVCSCAHSLTHIEPQCSGGLSNSSRALCRVSCVVRSGSGLMLFYFVSTSHLAGLGPPPCTLYSHPDCFLQQPLQPRAPIRFLKKCSRTAARPAADCWKNSRRKIWKSGSRARFAHLLRRKPHCLNRAALPITRIDPRAGRYRRSSTRPDRLQTAPAHDTRQFPAMVGSIIRSNRDRSRSPLPANRADSSQHKLSLSPGRPPILAIYITAIPSGILP